MKSIWLDMLSEFDFEIRYIKGKENMVVDALNISVQVNHIAIMSSYGTYFEEKILQEGKHHDRYQRLRHRLQQ